MQTTVNGRRPLRAPWLRPFTVVCIHPWGPLAARRLLLYLDLDLSYSDEEGRDMSESAGPDRSYRGLIEKVAEIYRDPERVEMLGQHSTVSYRVTSYLANIEGWLYHCGGPQVSAESAKRHLVTLCGETVGGFGLHAAASRSDGRVTAAYSRRRSCSSWRMGWCGLRSRPAVNGSSSRRTR